MYQHASWKFKRKEATVFGCSHTCKRSYGSRCYEWSKNQTQSLGLEPDVPGSTMQSSIENKVWQKHKQSNGLVLMVTGFDCVRNRSTIKAAMG